MQIVPWSAHSEDIQFNRSRIQLMSEKAKKNGIKLGRHEFFEINQQLTIKLHVLKFITFTNYTY